MFTITSTRIVGLIAVVCAVVVAPQALAATSTHSRIFLPDDPTDNTVSLPGDPSDQNASRRRRSFPRRTTTLAISRVGGSCSRQPRPMQSRGMT